VIESQANQGINLRLRTAEPRAIEEMSRGGVVEWLRRFVVERGGNGGGVLHTALT
jgi:hypothetical protein